MEEFLCSGFTNTDLHPQSTQEEREQMGACLLEISMDWKRILSPMLALELVQEALVLILREAKR